MPSRRLAILATLVAAAGCTSQPPPSQDYVPAGQSPAISRDQALRECRQQVESAGRATSPALGPLPVRQIPPPPSSMPEYTSIQSCMEAKGFRRAAP